VDKRAGIGHSALVTARPPTADERAFLDTVLRHSFDGVEALRSQWEHALVEPSCQCGCGSIGFVFNDLIEVMPSTAPSPLPVEGEILDTNGEAVGGIIVLVRDGVLDDVDVHAFGDRPLAFPEIGTIRWVT
jgi:hypothetical protein